MEGPTVRNPAVAGMFYPEDEEELRQMVKGYLDDVEEISLEGKLRGLVVPHAGYIYSGPVAAYGYALLARYQNIKKIVLIGPSHNAVFNGACEAGFDFWETPLGKVRAKSIREKLNDKEKKTIHVYPQAHSMEHCLEVQLPFLQLVMKNEFEICPLLTGNVDAADLAYIIAGQLDNKSLVIISSDLSHYLPYDTAIKVDSIANESVPSLDIGRFEREGDACGKTAILTLMHIATKKGWKGKLLEYKNSGDTAGPKTGVVGYGCYAFHSND